MNFSKYADLFVIYFKVDWMQGFSILASLKLCFVKVAVEWLSYFHIGRLARYQVTIDNFNFIIFNRLCIQNITLYIINIFFLKFGSIQFQY